MAALAELNVLTAITIPALFKVPVTVVTKTPLGPDVVSTVVTIDGCGNCDDGNGFVGGMNGGSEG
jgi:hypothetical protein